MKRIFLIGLFGFGTVAGFAHGFAHLGHCRSARRDAWEDHVADVCTRSAERVYEERAAVVPVALPAPVAAPTITIAAPATVTVAYPPAPVALPPVAPAATPTLAPAASPPVTP